jgi:hyaluronoglucosaminidase
VFLWDNYPVNDYPRTTGRLLLAPYARRANDLDRHVTGVAANPMNQAAASKVALVGVADFTWNPAAYDPARAHRAAAQHLAGARRTGAGAAGDEATVGSTVEALLAFFDLEHFVPTSAPSSGVIGQPQAPVLAGRLDAFRDRWSGGDRSGALDELRPYAELLAGAPDRIRQGVTDPGFAADCAPWLDALALWGQAFVAALEGLAARVSGDEATAQARFGEAAALAAQAGGIQTVPGETLPQGPVEVGDGVLDTFLAEAPTLS